MRRSRCPERKDFDLLALDDALNSLAKIDPQQARIVELRFFTGLTVEETAEVLGISPATVKRDWVTAKAWLYRDISRATEPDRCQPATPMTPERWQRVKELLNAALELEPSRRAALPGRDLRRGY